MAHVDPSTGRPRGFMRMGRHPRLDSVLFTLDVRDQHWRAANRWAPGVLSLLLNNGGSWRRTGFKNLKMFVSSIGCNTRGSVPFCPRRWPRGIRVLCGGRAAACLPAAQNSSSIPCLLHRTLFPFPACLQLLAGGDAGGGAGGGSSPRRHPCLRSVGGGLRRPRRRAAQVCGGAHGGQRHARRRVRAGCGDTDVPAGAARHAAV
jgi:hypothetical protein